MPVIVFAAAVIAFAVWGMSSASATTRNRRRGMSLAEMRAIDPRTATVEQVERALVTLLGPEYSSRIDESEARVILDGIIALGEAAEDDPEHLALTLAHSPRVLNATATIEANFSEAERAVIAERIRTRLGLDV